MWWGYGFHPFGFFFFGLLIVLLLVRIFAYRRCGWGRGWHDGRADAEAILRRRLAAGEISEADYQRLRDVLKA